MIRTTVYLDEDDKRRLADQAAASGLTEAELIRRGVRHVIAADQTARKPRAGYANSRDGRSARDTDEMLAETGFGT